MISAQLDSYDWSVISQMLNLDEARPAPTRNHVQVSPLTPYAEAKISALMKKSCVDTERTAHLLTLAGTIFAYGFDTQECIDRCLTWNANNNPPLEDVKIFSTCESIARYYPVKSNVNGVLKTSHSILRFTLDDGRISPYLTTPPPLREWLIDDMIVLGKVGAIVAAGGSSKSQFLLQMAVTVVTGIPLAGHWTASQTGSALIFFAEDDRDEIHRR